MHSFRKRASEFVLLVFSLGEIPLGSVYKNKTAPKHNQNCRTQALRMPKNKQNNLLVRFASLGRAGDFVPDFLRVGPVGPVLLRQTARRRHRARPVSQRPPGA